MADTRLSAFLAALVAEAAEGIRDAQRLQSDRRAEAATLAAADVKTFAERAVTDDDVTREIERLDVRAGAPLRPDLAALLASHRPKKGAVLTNADVLQLRRVVGERLAVQMQQTLRATLARGVPEVVVDSGTISAPISLTIAPSGIVVRTIDDRAPQNQQLRVDSIGRLEVTFKTVT